MRIVRAPLPFAVATAALAIAAIPLAIGLFRKHRAQARMEGVANVPQSGIDPTEGLRAD